jgi:dTDP-4-amino-4,6-dideoxygalactose transaminase
MSMIPLLDLKSQYASLRPEIIPALERVLEGGRYTLGEEVERFESDFAAYSGSSDAIAVNSGTSALHLALLAAGIGPGDEVITVPFTFVATVAAIYYAGATPVLVDIHPESLTMDPEGLASAITAKTKAIIPVHLHGRPADMDPIMERARQHGLTVIEDAAQAHGATYRGKPVGSIGQIGCFSFYPGKNLGAYGEGGLVTTSDEKIAKAVRLLRDWGASVKYHHTVKGYNYRLDAIQGAALRVKLRHLERWTEARRQVAKRYDDLLKGTELSGPETVRDARHVYHVYAVRVANRAEVQARMRQDGVETGIHYPVPVHLQPAYAVPEYRTGSFPHSEEAAGEVLSLPIYPELSEEQQRLVVGSLLKAVKASEPVSRIERPCSSKVQPSAAEQLHL